MAKSVLLRRYDKQYFAFEPQSPLYEDYALAGNGPLKATILKDNDPDPSQTFLVFPETDESTDTFRIFNQSNGKAWSKLGDIIGEQDVNLGDPAQIFKLQEIPDQDSEFQIVKSAGFLYVCAPTLTDQLSARPVGDTVYVPRCDSFLPSSGGTLPTLEIRRHGNLQKLPPKLTKHEAQHPTTKPYATRVLRLPFFMVEDNQKDAAWKVQNSPWYYLRRQMTYFSTDDWFIFNENPVAQERSWTTTKGWSKTDSDSFSVTTGLKVTVKASFFGNEVATEISLALGYTSTTALTESYTEATTVKINAAPNGTTVMWQPQSTITLLRSDGTEVSRWVRNESRLYYRFLAIKDKKTKQFVMKSTEDRARILTDDGEITEFASIATLVGKAAKGA